MKKCSKCKIKKELTEFNKNCKRKDGYNTICRDCMKIYLKTYYRKDPKAQYKRAKERRKELVLWLNEIKRQKKCLCCDETEIVCLDFHHIGKKDIDISDMLRNGYSKKNIEKELAKCICVCSNCHRKIHAGIITDL
jgi:hypothetical protein